MQPFQQKSVLVIFVSCLCLLGVIGYLLVHDITPSVAQSKEVMEIMISIDADGNVISRKYKKRGGGSPEDVPKVQSGNHPTSAQKLEVYTWKENPTCTLINQGGVWYKICT